MKKISLITALQFIFLLSFSQKLMIFGGKDHDEFLGNYNTDQFDLKSIWNEFGTYGSQYNIKSIWNEFATYGNPYSDYSPFNAYARHPPVIVDSEGNFYGYFTSNEYNPKRTKLKSAIFILKNVELIRGNLDEAYKLIFEQP